MEEIKKIDPKKDDWNTGDLPHFSNDQLVDALEYVLYKMMRGIIELKEKAGLDVFLDDIGRNEISARLLKEFRKRLQESEEHFKEKYSEVFALEKNVSENWRDFQISLYEDPHKDYFKHLTEELEELESTHDTTICYKCKKQVPESIELIHTSNTDSVDISDFILLDVAICRKCFNEIIRKTPTTCKRG
jgi:hypothetical protein